MTENELLKRISLDPKVMTGKPTIRGLRITVEQILRSLAANVSMENLLRDYPELELADIQACILHASKLVEEERVFELRSP